MRNERIGFRIPAAEKELWQQIADQHGITLTQLVIRSVRGSIAALQAQKPVELPGSRLS